MRAPDVAWVAAVVLVAGCGYGFGAGGGIVPTDARTISIGLFENDTRERGLEVALRQAIEEEFRRRGQLVVVDDAADIRLEGRLRRLGNLPVAFARANEAVEFQARLVVGLRVLDGRTGAVLLQSRQVQETTDFAADRSVVISTSPAFQQDSADARDLAQFTNVPFTESNRARARDRLVTQMAQQVYLVTMEAF